MEIRVETGKKLKGRTARLLRRFGIAECDIDPKPIGKGGGHTVYTFIDGQQVVKIPHIRRVDKPLHQLPHELNTLKSYFQDAYVPTTIVQDQKDHCIVMDKVPGKYVYSSEARQDNDVRVNLVKLVDANLKYVEETGNMVDFLGFGGWISGLFARDPYLSNVLHSNGSMRLIDNDILDLNHQNILIRANRRLTLAMHTHILKDYFGIAFKPRIPKKS